MRISLGLEKLIDDFYIDYFFSNVLKCFKIFGVLIFNFFNVYEMGNMFILIL